MNLPLELSKQEIVKLFRSGRIGEDFNNRLDKVIQTIYDEGREMGMTEALNFVENNADRERLFEGIDQLREELDNEC